MKSNISYLYHNDWSSISIEIWLNVCKQDAHPAIHSGNILCVNSITHSNRKLTNKKYYHIEKLLASIAVRWRRQTDGTKSSDILILAFVVFNPGDLYYLGYKKKLKKIIIIVTTIMFMVLSS